jgi:hypothetical protein
MSDKKISKVIYGGTTLIDLTGDTVVANKLLSGYKAHGADGEQITGSCTYDADTQDANAAASEVLSNKTAYVKGSKVTGSMPNRGAIAGTISTIAGEYTVSQGYHDGSGKVAIDSTEQAKCIAENIRQGVTLLGVAGSMTGTEDVNAETKSVTPSTSAQTILPDTQGGYNYIAEVDVAAIPYTETENSAGGLTATIG